VRSHVKRRLRPSNGGLCTEIDTMIENVYFKWGAGLMSGICPKSRYEGETFVDCRFHGNINEHVEFVNCVFFDCEFPSGLARLNAPGCKWEYTHGNGYTDAMFSLVDFGDLVDPELAQAWCDEEANFWHDQPWDVVWNPYVSEETFSYHTLRVRPE
jgi:hypothetical protein